MECTVCHAGIAYYLSSIIHHSRLLDMSFKKSITKEKNITKEKTSPRKRHHQRKKHHQGKQGSRQNRRYVVTVPELTCITAV